MTRKFHFAELHIGSPTRYKHTSVGNHFVKWKKFKRILISFNCFSSIYKLYNVFLLASISIFQQKRNSVSKVFYEVHIYVALQ